MRLAAALITIAFLVASHSPASACSCGRSYDLSNLDAYDQVFLGQVIERGIHDRTARGRGGPRQIQLNTRFRVVASWKGTPDQELVVHSQATGFSCGSYFVEPGWYIVTAQRAYPKDGRPPVLKTSICLGNRWIRDENGLTEALTFLGQPDWGRAEITPISPDVFHLCDRYLGVGHKVLDVRGSHRPEVHLSQEGREAFDEFVHSHLGKIFRVVVGDRVVWETALVEPTGTSYFFGDEMTGPQAASLVERLGEVTGHPCGL